MRVFDGWREIVPGGWEGFRREKCELVYPGEIFQSSMDSVVIDSAIIPSSIYIRPKSS